MAEDFSFSRFYIFCHKNGDDVKYVSEADASIPWTPSLSMAYLFVSDASAKEYLMSDVLHQDGYRYVIGSVIVDSDGMYPLQVIV